METKSSLLKPTLIGPGKCTFFKYLPIILMKPKSELYVVPGAWFRTISITFNIPETRRLHGKP